MPLPTSPPRRLKQQPAAESRWTWWRVARYLLLFASCVVALVDLHANWGRPPPFQPPPARATVVAPMATRAPPPRNTTPSFPSPLLTTLELLTLQSHVRGSHLYVEWGSGASTSLVAPFARHAVSIDNNAEWCGRVAGRDDVAWWVAHGVLKLVCVDTGPTVAFGAPGPGADPATFPTYSAAIDDAVAEVEAEGKGGHNNHHNRRLALAARRPSFPTTRVDVALVDGRFRVACALRALRHVVPGAGVVAVHDWTERPAYGDALAPFYNVVEIADRLAVLTPKRHVDWTEWAAALGRYEKDPA